MAPAERKKVERKSAVERAGQIRAAARDLAREEGLVAVTLRGVAQRIGVVPALVAHYEPSMEVLVAETFRAIAGAEVAEVMALTSGDEPAPVRLRTLIATTLDPTRERVTAVWVDAWSLGRRNAALADAVREAADAWQAHVVGIIHDGMRSGDFAEVDADAVAWLLIGVFDGLNAQSAIHHPAGPDTVGIVQRTVERELGLPAAALGAVSGGWGQAMPPATA